MTDELPSISDFFVCVDDCPWCLGTGHVCEDHPGKPWAYTLGEDDPRSCNCGAAGMPCPGGLP